jgi:hypothetical protein
MAAKLAASTCFSHEIKQWCASLFIRRFVVSRVKIVSCTACHDPSVCRRISGTLVQGADHRDLRPDPRAILDQEQTVFTLRRRSPCEQTPRD